MIPKPEESTEEASKPDDPREGEPREDDLFGPDSIEESLTEALNDLEKILDGNAEPADTETKQSLAPNTDLSATTDHGAGEQYTIPLLNDVVIPGIGVPQNDPTDEDRGTAGPAPDRLDPAAMMAQLTGPATDIEPGGFVDPEQDEAGRRRRVADRLASEVEVIVQARLEVALQNACDEIREQVRNHLDIILPEIVDDMLQHRQDKND